MLSKAAANKLSTRLIGTDLSLILLCLISRCLAWCTRERRPTSGRASLIKLNGSKNLFTNIRLLDLTIMVLNEPLVTSRAHSTVHALPTYTASVEIRVLPTMTVKVLRLKIIKSLKGKAKLTGSPSSFRLWGLVRRGSPGQVGGLEAAALEPGVDRGWIVLDMSDDSAELDYVGLESGSYIALSVV